jgi:preprotein translocase subunit SecD
VRIPTRAAALAALALTSALAACSTGTGDAPDETTTVVTAAQPVIETPITPSTAAISTFLVTPGENTGVDLEDLATAIERRLSAAGHVGVFTQVEGTGVRVEPGDGPLAPPAIEELLTEPGRLEIRAVREEQGRRHCSDDSGAQGAGEDSVYPEHDEETGEISACYVLAPGGVSNPAIESATATVNPPDGDGDRTNDSAVDLVLTFDGIDTFNELAADCKNRRDPCDSGLAGIALDRVVIMAPRVKDANFERHSIQISGDMDEEEANSLAAALTTAPLPRGLEFSH